MRVIKKTILILFAVYIAVCSALYFAQKIMLFPAYVAKPVPANWQPSAGDAQQQALINGHCGKLHAVIWRINKAKGTIMMFHGNGESLASINDYAYAFHALGYNLMAWDYPGYGRSTDCWFSQDDLLNDAESAYQWLATQEKPEKIFIFGYSIGTGIALSVAANHQQNPVYLVAGYDSLFNIASERMLSIIPVHLIMRYPMHTAVWIAKMKQPIYLIHGVQDTLIQPARAKALVQAAQGKAKIEWVQGAGHTSDSLFLYRNQWLKRLLP